MSGYESAGPPEKVPDTQPASSGGLPQPPPRPPKLTARELLDPGEPGGRIFVPDFIELKQLAELLGLKPFKVVAEVLELLVHELAHVVQYERLGGFRAFLRQYLQECITPGYPFGELEQEAKKAEFAYC